MRPQLIAADNIMIYVTGYLIILCFNEAAAYSCG